MPTPIIVNVNFIDLTGSVVTGYMEAAIVSPSGVYDLYVTGTGIIAPKTITSGIGTSVAVAIWGNDVVVDMVDGETDTYYTVNLFKADNTLIWSAAYLFTGAGPINLVGYPSLTILPPVPTQSQPQFFTPAGNNGDVQFNNNGLFGGTDAFRVSGSAVTITGTLAVTGSITAGTLTVNGVSVFNPVPTGAGPAVGLIVESTGGSTSNPAYTGIVSNVEITPTTADTAFYVGLGAQADGEGLAGSVNQLVGVRGIGGLAAHFGLGATCTGFVSGVQGYINFGGAGAITCPEANAMHATTPLYEGAYFPTITNGLKIENQGNAAWASNGIHIVAQTSPGKALQVDGGLSNFNDAVTLANPVVATSLANHSSPVLTLGGTYWTGAVSAADIWNVQDVVGTGTNPTSTLTFTHTGSSGSIGISLNANVALSGILTANSGITTGTINIIDENPLNFQAFDGATRKVASITEIVTLNTSGTTTDSITNLLPANSIIEAVTARIIQTISGGSTPTTWEAGDATTAARFISTGNALTATTTAVGLNQMKGGVSTDATGPTQAAAAKLRITLDQIPGQGSIEFTVFYTQFTPPIT